MRHVGWRNCRELKHAAYSLLMLKIFYPETKAVKENTSPRYRGYFLNSHGLSVSMGVPTATLQIYTRQRNDCAGSYNTMSANDPEAFLLKKKINKTHRYTCVASADRSKTRGFHLGRLSLCGIQRFIFSVRSFLRSRRLKRRRLGTGIRLCASGRSPWPN